MSNAESLAILGIAETAGWALVQQMVTADGSLDAMKAACRESVYWPEFCALAAAGEVPSGWQREPIATAVVGWAVADHAHIAPASPASHPLDLDGGGAVQPTPPLPGAVD